MKQSDYVFSLLTEDDFEVASILLELCSVREFEPARGFKLFWETRKKRSVRKVKKESTAAVCQSPYLQPSSSPSVCLTADVCSAPAADEAESRASPDTPLFLPSIEADENFKNSKTKETRKRKREDLMEIINQLTQNRELLKRELQNVRKYHLKQETLNFQFKALRHHLLDSGEILLRKPPEKSQVLPGVDHMYQNNNQHQPSWNHNHHQPLIFHQTAARAGIHQSCSSSSYGGSLLVTELGRTQNTVVDSSMPLDQMGRRIAAIARHRRKEIYRSKNSNASSKLMFSSSR